MKLAPKHSVIFFWLLAIPQSIIAGTPQAGNLLHPSEVQNDDSAVLKTVAAVDKDLLVRSNPEAASLKTAKAVEQEWKVHSPEITVPKIDLGALSKPQQYSGENLLD